tara:strand:+ start:512 stop:679 length:168 start_codon:yes stop_codon:yes gene_type:complete
VVIDFTNIFEVIHGFWDFIGILIVIGFGLAVAAVVFVASVAKVIEVRESKSTGDK